MLPQESNVGVTGWSSRFHDNHLYLVAPEGECPEEAVLLEWPDVAGLTLLDAALEYARFGWCVLPTAPTDIKNPGSVVGGKWQNRSSRDPKQITKWWTSNPNYGIALHCGRSGAIAFDLDIDDLTQISRDGAPNLAKALKNAGGVHLSRRQGDRGHYIFLMPDGAPLGNGAGAFRRWGQVRGHNGVIVAAPTPHPDAATKGGHYATRRAGALTNPPRVLRECLAAAAHEAEPLSLGRLGEFLDSHTGDDRPDALKGVLTKFAENVDAGASRHDSMCEDLCWAFREAVAGCYPAQRAYDALREAFAAVKPRHGDEFDRLVRWAAAQALQSDPAETLARMDRHVWPSPRAPWPMSEAVDKRTRAEDRPLRYWRGDWYRYVDTHHYAVSEDELRKFLYELLETAQYLNKEGAHIPWNPTDSTLSTLIQAMKARMLVGDGLDSGSWLDGRKDFVIPCSNGLLRVDDRVLLDHSPRFFATHSLPFPYDPQAKAQRWGQFLDEVWPGDAEAHALLQEWFGYVLSGRTDLQKMLMIIGVTRSGKGTIARLLRQMVSPDVYVGLSSRDLAGQFGLAPLVGRSLAVFSDDRMTVRGNDVVETLLRITGEDVITADRKHKQPWRGILPTRLMFISNEVPTFPDASQAITGRILRLYMGMSWLDNEDPQLADNLFLELPGIFNWALEGLGRLDSNSGRFTAVSSTDHIGKLLRTGASPLREFADEECTVGAGETVAKKALYAAWQEWANANGRAPGSSADFGRKLFAAYGKQIANCKVGPRGKQLPGYRGIGLRHDPETFTNGVRRAY